MAKSSADMLKSTRPGVMSGHLLNGVRVSHQEAQSDWDSLANTRDDVVRIDVPADPQERMAFVRRWMANNQKALKQGGMAATLVLPLLAQQALADPMVAVNDLQGVAEVIRQPNGSLTLIMNSGQRIDMAAADVALENGRVVVDIDSLMELLGNDSGLLVPLSQLPDVQTWELLPDGNVLITRPDGTQMVIERGALVQQGDLFLISPSNALQQGIASGEDFGNLLFVPSASFANQPSSTSSFPSTASSSSEPVSSFGDIPPWLYVGGGAIAVGAAAAGGGGGGGGGDGGPATISGYVVDGYISGATVTRAVNSNQVTTNDDGFFSGLQGSGILTATGGVDISTGLPFTGVLRAPEDATVITPLTTLMVQLSQQFGLNDADAQTAIKTALGLDQRIDLMTTDPLAEASPNLDLLIAGVKVASLLAMAATAGISSADALSRLGTAFNQASDAGRELTNQEMADALGLPSIAGQVKQALDAIDNASDGLNIDAYRDGNNNPLRDAQRNAQDPNSDLSDTIGTRAEVPYLTLQQAVALAANDELPANYLINPNQPFAAGTLGLTAAGNQLALVETVLAGDFDVATAPIALGDIYTWSIRADAEDVLVSGGLGRPEVVGAQSVTLTNTTIRPDQFADLNTLDNFDLGSTVVPYTLEQALATDVMPANYTLNPSRPFSAGDLTVREAAELIDSTRVLLDLAQNTDSDNLTRDLLLEWNIVDSLATILGTPSARPQIAEANSISVTEAIITPAQFVQLNALPNFVLGETEVDYTLAEALAADPLASNYIIDLQAVLNAGTVTVDEAETEFANVSRVLEGANNQPPLTLFEWVIRDDVGWIIADLDQGHVIEANQVSAKDRVITSAQFDQLKTLDNFELGTTIVRYTLENAVNADELAANYDIDTTVPFEAGEVSVDAAATRLAAVERILDGALNTQTPNADALFNWTVVDSASSILEARNVPHLTRADAVNVSDDIITIAQFEALSAADFNYVRLGELVEYTLANAIYVIDAGNGPLVADYVIDLETSFNDVWTVAQGASYFAIIAGAENRTALLGSDAVVWQVEDSIGNLINGISNENPDDNAFDDDAIVNAQTVRVLGATITQAQYEELLGVLGNTLRLDAGEDAVKTTVTYANLEAAVGAVRAGGGDVLAPSEFYSITDSDARYIKSDNPLSVADALDEIALVKRVLDGAVGRSAAEFGTLYEWTIRDTARNILDEIENAGSALPEVLASAGITNSEEVSIFAANAPDENGEENILADQYDDLVAALGENGFGYNQVEYTLAYVFDETANTFADPDELADRFFFTEDVFEINDSLGGGNINVVLAAEYYSAVQTLVDRSSDPLDVKDIYRWSVLDSASNIVTAYANNGNQHPPHIREATLVEINDTAVITFEQYGILEQIPEFEIQSYTLEEAVDIYREDNSELVANYIIDDSTPYLAEELSLDQALEYRNAVSLIVDESEQSARNARLDSTALDELYSWTVLDTAAAILTAGNTNENISGAIEVYVSDDVITSSNAQTLIRDFSNFVLGDTPVSFIFTETLELSQIERITENYQILSDGNIPNFDLSGVSSAEARYTETQEIVNGAINRNDVSVEQLQTWTIADAGSVELFNARAEAWVTGADSITLDLSAGATLTPEQYEAFLVLENVILDTASVEYTLQQAVEFVDGGGVLPEGTTARPGSYQIESSTVYSPANTLSVDQVNALLGTVNSVLAVASNSDDLDRSALFSWAVVDTADTLIGAIDEVAVTGADSVRVDVPEIGYEDFEALSVLDNFNQDGLTVSYPLGELVERFLSGEDIPATYAIDTGAALFEAGALDVHAAERLYDTATTLIDGAVNSDVSLSSLTSWIVQDTFDNIYTQNIAGRDDPAAFLVSEAATIYVVDDDLEPGERQSLALELDPDGFEERPELSPGGSIDQLSKTFAINGQPDGDVELITDFRVGEALGRDELFIELETSDVEMLRGYDMSNVSDNVYSAGFGKYDVTEDGVDSATLADTDVAFAVFTTAEFGANGANWLSELGLQTGEVIYLLAGNSDTQDNLDDALLLRVEAVEENSVTGDSLGVLATFDNLNLDGFSGSGENWNTNYSIIT
ncbi:calcium-binding protein [Vreelandella piezotolerans]|uniref:Calcium-binding protein n=1 Tax=Vreelandella piezotolerans TaxID=2609667 RepID=A0ABQ6X4Z8_9GAMM|nr:calcium-binding protein [Halomonas piezotolerans]KAE8437104.1 calcium-binding protein [Halomonas piezotolerans]QJA23196.1 calcium-binding protein [Halomonas piezotolerans]